MKYLYAFALFFLLLHSGPTTLKAQVLQSIESETEGPDPNAPCSPLSVLFKVLVFHHPGNSFDAPGCLKAVGLTINSDTTLYITLPSPTYDNFGSVSLEFEIPFDLYAVYCSNGRVILDVTANLYYDCPTGYYLLSQASSVSMTMSRCCPVSLPSDTINDPQTSLTPDKRNARSAKLMIEVNHFQQENYFLVENISKQSGFAEIFIFNMQGVLMMKDRIWIASDQAVNFEYNHPPSGAYFVKIGFKDQIFNQKFIQI